MGIVQKSVFDYLPFGHIDKEEADDYASDCSCGCKHFLALKGKLGSDWGVCTNPESHRCGMLTFEHQGCLDFEAKKD